MAKSFDRNFQIVLVQTTSVFVGFYPFAKWCLSKDVSVFKESKLVQSIWYIANIQIGVWYSSNEVSFYG